ncbi:spermatogenesis-associated protein 17 [Thalassophryne amazonica]|uniref:spermatogenesis-associated protein 17 n=1 Tax=Thalassophryne amazonica TaxID=390379 RepID=UPI001471376E|nr:spermatogenesis-associated protein 17 [Thalassophryne amazonica]XP_034043998.1 spermatogenesis-associated protein 17 [Thalassophryne amazonica]
MTQRLKGLIEEFKNNYFNANRLAEENRQKENHAATLIQSWFRGCRLRAYLSCLHKKAIIIQKIWRGFIARTHYRQMVEEAYFIMKMNFYNEMAVRIQRQWRGFYVRKYIHSYYARKRYLQSVAIQNDAVRRKLDEFEELQMKERECLLKVKEHAKKVHEAHRLHHLLSTHQCPGVFNSPFRSSPHEMELLLRRVKYQAPTRLSPGDKAHIHCTPGLTPPFENVGSPWMKSTSRCNTCRPILPPITSKKQQVHPVCPQKTKCASVHILFFPS